MIDGQKRFTWTCQAVGLGGVGAVASAVTAVIISLFWSIYPNITAGTIWNIINFIYIL